MKCSIFLLAAGLRAVAAVTIAEINGNRFLSSRRGAAVTDVTGLLIAKGPNGIWIRSTTPDDDPTTSEAIYVFSSTVGANLTVGDIVTLDGTVTEYRSSPDYLYLTEITAPRNVRRVSTGNTVTPLVIGVDTPSPPTLQFSSLDGGDVYALPNWAANVSVANPPLDPTNYGLDFWESLSGELVTVRGATVNKVPNNFRDTWVVGDWAATGRNAHGGITMSDRDSNPEAIIIGTPLDGTRNPTTTKMGDRLADITGIVQQTFGFYYILPLTALRVETPAVANAPPTSLESAGTCKGVTVGGYNVENLAPTSAHLPRVAAHIVNYLKTPDLVFLQEVQDGSGATDNGVVSGNATLTALANSIRTLSNTSYAFSEVVPANNQDGGAPGGNIRQAFLYKPDVLSLWKPNAGDADDDTTVLPGQGERGINSAPFLSFNPGRISPGSEAWTSSRKPLVAAWRAKGAKKPFYTVNVHWSSKGGSTSLQGDARPPINGVVGRRELQANVTGSFIAEILKLDPVARVIAAGDFNEFSFVGPMRTFAAVSGLVDLDEAAGIPVEERYTYAFDMNAQALDHMYVSPALGRSKTTKYEHIHVNTWAADADAVSDHDPSVALFDVCGCS